jgi:type I restriction-modification system DNA methylase subunit
VVAPIAPLQPLHYAGKADDSQRYTKTAKFPIPGAGVRGRPGFADLALGHFTKAEQKAQVLVEFKDQRASDLDKPSTRKDRLSPTNQCWHYLETYNQAKWGIVTNFNEIRVYCRNRGKAQVQTFFFVVPDALQPHQRPLTDKNELLKFISILHCNQLLGLKGPSAAEAMLEHQVLEEKQLESMFYDRYRLLRERLFWTLLKYNPQYEAQKLALLKHVQKCLDRIIFCWFCEDSREHLLSPGVLTQLLASELSHEHYQPEEEDIWSRMKKLFHAIDKGGNYNIRIGYNGGLFREDQSLESLCFPNHLFEGIHAIGQEYDFGDESELDVNVLGHIFEQSIEDLEEMRQRFIQEEKGSSLASSMQQELDLNDARGQDKTSKKTLKNRTKAKREGVFYTPDHITNYIVDAAVGAYLATHFSSLERKHARAQKGKQRRILIDYRDNVLAKIRILDPACGSGAFLVAAFNYLWAEHQRIHKLLKDLGAGEQLLVDSDAIERTILENNLFGVDLNNEAVEITKLSLWLKTASRDKKLNSLSHHIRTGNSIIDQESVDPEAAFAWDKMFPDTIQFTDGGELSDGFGFDCVIGNPPYDVLSEKETGRAVDHEIAFFKRHPVLRNAVKGKNNLYKLFICRSLSLTRDGGFFSFIVPLPLAGDAQAVTVRKYLYDNSVIHSLDCFPQKDNPKKRVFERAKQSTCIFCTQKGSPSLKKPFRLRRHPGKYFEATWENGLQASVDEIATFDPVNRAIPVCGSQEWDIIKKIVKLPYFERLGSVAEQFQGEINESTDGRKGCLTKQPGYTPVLRGANLTRYQVREASQGEVWFADDVKLLAARRAGSKVFDFRKARIGFQRSAPQDNYRRIIAAPLPENVFCFDTVSYVTEDSAQISLFALLALLNSNLFDWWFSASSTNSKVNQYQFNNLPFVKLTRDNRDISDEVDRGMLPELIAAVGEKAHAGRGIPLWTVQLLAKLAEKAVAEESRREIALRKDRAFLGSATEVTQRYINAVVYAMFRLDEEDVAVIES